MQLSPQSAVCLGVVLLFLAFAGIAIYVAICNRIAAVGGKVRVDQFAGPDFVVVAMLLSYLFLAIFLGFFVKDKPVEIRDSLLVNSAVAHYLVLTFIFAFIQYRKIDVLALFGFRGAPFWRTVGMAFLLVLAAEPAIHCVSMLTQVFLKIFHGKTLEPQELVLFFEDALKKGNYRSVFLTAFTGVVVAPVVEEVVFRGYIYGVMKRFIGLVAGVLFTSLLFAAVHMNIPSFAALFLLAVCLTIAYEYTGSLLTNICMHAFFNASAFGLMYLNFLSQQK